MNIGFCQCGCGERTTRTLHDDRARGLKAGDYSRFIKGHWHNAQRARNPNYGAQYQRLVRRDAIRVIAAREASNVKSLAELRERVGASDFRIEGLSRLLSIARDFNWNEQDIPELPAIIRKPVPPPYERQIIPYEFETEIPLLTNSARFMSLDEPTEDGRTAHSWLRHSNDLTPLDILIEKEEEAEHAANKLISECATKIALARRPMRKRRVLAFGQQGMGCRA